MKRFAFLATILIMLTWRLDGQTSTQFSGDPTAFKSELNSFMSTSLSESNKIVFDQFLSFWDSTSFSPVVKEKIINVGSQLRGRRIRPVPGFLTYINTLTTFATAGQGEEKTLDWLSGLSEAVFNPRFSNNSIVKFIEVSGLFILDNTIFSEGSIAWKVKGGEVDFVRDTLFLISIKNATITCFQAKDSTEIFDFSGIYIPESFLLRCDQGEITWEKAGFSRDSVFANVYDFNIDVTKSEFRCDSSFLTHANYFKEPVKGSLTDRASHIISPEKASVPTFVTDETRFMLDDIYDGVDYEGGLKLEGALIHGTGSSYFPATINLYRNDTLYVRVKSRNFILSKKNITSSEVSATLYLDKDSIFHSNQGFSYITSTREVSLFRTPSPLTRSPFFDSFHNLDLYFENLSWDMDDSFATLSRTRGSSIGVARFESVSFYNENIFYRLMRLDDVHPLYRIRDYAKYYGSDVFPVESFAKWIKMPVEQAIALCIELSNNGFLFYDRYYNEVTIKKKLDDYIVSFAKRKDYDAINITSETSGEEENAILDLKSYRLNLCGVDRISLSDSQNVSIMPYEKKVTIGQNRSISFNGIVNAGLFKIYGNEFTFRYDTFYIRLQKIDSIKISVETGEKDMYGRPIIKPIDNMIQLGTAELFIDDPKNKSGLKSLEQYPIINAITYSYIFYDKIPGLEGIYPQTDFYFRVDPFTYTNLDHYTNTEIALEGEFIGSGIIEPMRQTLTIQPDNSLGFSMTVAPEGIAAYGSRGMIYDHLSMSNKGLISSGKLTHLTATAVADTFRFYPDSMKTSALSFTMAKDPTGRFPELSSSDVSIKWLTGPDEWHVVNNTKKVFNMYANGTSMDGSLVLRPTSLDGKGVINTSDARITSNTFSFSSITIDADTSDYYLKALRGSGYGFVATDANTHVNFETQRTAFSLNTDSSLVVLPEIEYISKMTNFDYNMKTKVLDMWQRGRESQVLMDPGELLKVPLGMVEKPTFLSTNNMKDTVRFQSGNASYFLEDEYLKVENINYIPVADALIQPGEGKITISKGAKIHRMENSVVAVNNRHLIHSASIDIESSAFYSGSGIYDYIDEENTAQPVTMNNIRVDTMATSAQGYISIAQEFRLSPAFTFTGDVALRSANEHLRFTGATGIVSNCSNINNIPVKFSATIDPNNILIPVDEKPRDINDNLVFSGTFITLDSAGVYGTFLSERESWSDNPLVNSSGYLFYDKGAGKYRIASLEKLSDLSLNGNMVTFDKNYCILGSEGKVNFGTNFDLLKMESAGMVVHNTDTSSVTVKALLGFSFFFSEEALTTMADEIRMMPTLKPVDLSKEIYTKAMQDLIGVDAARTLGEQLQLFGVARTLPKEFNYQMFLNDVTLKWNPNTMSFISEGRIGLGFIGTQPVNVYVDGYVEIQRKRSGDLLDIYLKAGNDTWYWFSYFRGVLMSYSSNQSYNAIITGLKEKDRKHPKSNARTPYKYMIGLPDRLTKFLNRMEGGGLYDDDLPPVE